MKHVAIICAVLALVLACSGVISGLAGLAVVAGGGLALDDLGRAVAEYLGSGSAPSLAIATLSTSLPMFVIAFALAGRLGSRREVLRLRRVALLDVVLAVIGMAAVSSAAGTFITLIGLADGGMLAQITAWFTAMPLATRAAMLPAMALGPGLAEELFFRGWVLSRGERFVSRRLAVVISAAAFGIVHMDPGHATAALIMGFFLAEVLLRTGSIYPTIIAHVVNNTIATLWPENDVGDGASGLVLGLSIIVAGLVLAALEQRHPQHAWRGVVRASDQVAARAVPETRPSKALDARVPAPRR